MNDHYDIIIIGSGAGGGTLVHRLASSGKKILILERGDYVKRERENWSTKAVNLEGRYNTKEVWKDKDGKELHPHTNYYVGGNTKFYGAALFRLRKEDFGELKHFGGVSPAWPISYDEIEPYYVEAENLYHVHGTRGEDPTEPYSSAPFPHPAISHEPRIQHLHDDLAAMGLKPFHVPLGVMLNEKNPRKSPCIRCATCDGHPCLVNAKSDAQVCGVDPALEHSNVTLLTNALVKRLETSSSGREVSKVHVERNGEKETYSANVVVVSAGAINSAALLLRSKNDKHPNGLANGSDVVGRHYMGHINSVLMAISKCPNPTVFQKTLGINDFYFGSKEWEFPMGHISFVGKLDADTLRAGAPAIAPGWTLDLMAKHSLDFWLTSEDLPDPNNRVSVDKEGNIVLSYVPNNEEGHKRLIAKLKELLKKSTKCGIHGHECHEGIFARSLYAGQRIPLGGVAHQNGTIRFGNDPKASALDRNCRAHEVNNLYIVDASFFPSSGAVNPALTIMANALRVGDRILEALRVKQASMLPLPPGEGRGEGVLDNRKASDSPRPLTLTLSRRERGQGALMLAVVLLFVAFTRAQTTRPAVSAVMHIGMTVDDMDRSIAFYSSTLDFKKASDSEVAGEQFEHLTGVFGARARIVQLRLGQETIELTQFLTPQGRLIPRDSRSNDAWFQHIAIVTSDMDRAYQRLRDNKVRFASTGPQRLPDWNPNAGGIRAFYFRDPDDHVLETIWFPTGKGDPKWQGRSELFPGIDHTAIVVSDTAKSLAFYRDVLGMRVAGESENYGSEQEHLNNVFGAHLHITGLRALSGPGVEFLEYLAPRDGRPYPSDEHANDLIHWQTTFITADAAGLLKDLRNDGYPLVSSGLINIDGANSAFVMRDPDGHAIQILTTSKLVAGAP